MAQVKRQLFATPRSSKRPRTTSAFVRAVRNVGETHYNNTPISHSATSSSSTILTSIVAGSGTENRNGRKISITGLEARFTNTYTSPFRVVIYVPKDASNILSFTGTYADAVDNDQYWVLFDNIYCTDGGLAKTINIRMPVRLTTEYNTTNGTAIRNPILMHISQTGNSTVLGHTKLWYKDF